MLELFVTSVDNNSDKVFVVAGLSATMQSLGYSTCVYKPIDVGAYEDNGSLQSLDLSYVKFVDPYVKTYFSYLFKANLPPILAGASEGLKIEKDVILKDFQNIQNINECTLIDGLSGLATPLNKDFLEEDIIKILDLPLLFTVKLQNSNINNIVLSINRAKDIGIDLRGVILTDFNKESIDVKLMPKLIENYTDAKVLGILPKLEKSVNPEDLITETLTNIDVESVFKLNIAKLR